MKQIGRDLTDPFDGFLAGMRYIILDRDPLYTDEFRGLLKQTGVKVIRLPARSPNLNAYADRFVRTIKESCLNQRSFLVRTRYDGRSTNSLSTIITSETTRGSVID